MPKFNADEKVFEPIEVFLGGKNYSILEVTQSMFNKIKEIATTVTDGTESIFQQLSILLSEDVDVLRKVDLRRASAVLKFLTDTITSQLEGKSGNV